MKTRILHIALENFAGLPWTIVQKERELGFDSDMITLYRTFQNFPQGKSLDLPFLGTTFGGRWLRFLRKGSLGNTRRNDKEIPPIWRPKRRIKAWLFDMRDNIWRRKIERSEVLKMIDEADIIVLDGGAGLLRSGEYLRKSGKDKIVEVFYGSDLRSRGIIEAVDEITKLRFTMEYDHIALYPGIKFLYFPFDYTKMPQPKKKVAAEKIRIGHSPTKRSTKGTDIILETLERLKREYSVEIVLIEGLPHSEAIERKRSCDIFIDQLGEIGYGISALEAVAMGIPTMVQLMPDFEKFLGDHPFINVNRDNLHSKIADLIENPELISHYESKGMEWLKVTHNALNIVQSMVAEYDKFGWLKGD